MLFNEKSYKCTDALDCIGSCCYLRVMIRHIIKWYVCFEARYCVGNEVISAYSQNYLTSCTHISHILRRIRIHKLYKTETSFLLQMLVLLIRIPLMLIMMMIMIMIKITIRIMILLLLLMMIMVMVTMIMTMIIIMTTSRITATVAMKIR